jgi:hypothetical protein
LATTKRIQQFARMNEWTQDLFVDDEVEVYETPEESEIRPTSLLPTVRSCARRAIATLRSLYMAFTLRAAAYAADLVKQGSI